MTDAAPEPPESEKSESLLERAMRRAREAGAAVPNESEAMALPVVGAATAAGVAATVKDVISPASYRYHTARPPQATLRVFTEALAALGDHDTRPEVTIRGDQATVNFRQQLPSGNWVTAVTITLVQASQEVNVTASAPSLAAMGGAAAEVGGATLSSLGKVLTGNVVGGLIEAARNVGRLTGSAENLALSNRIRETIQRVGNQLDDEWQQVTYQERLRAEQALMLSTCKFCGTPFASADETVCSACGAPRIQGKGEPKVK
ncbi:MAG: hypothetical protein NZM11_06320 [Anaerolineales bacterium]|nr:hypothetical protein [Anaerolineales bacterium]